MQLDRPPARRPILAIGLALALAATLPMAARADDPATAEFFEAKVRPILVERCQGCHGAEKAKGGLRLDSRAALLAGGDSGPALVAGKPEESPLVAAIGYAGDVQMPPKSKLPDDEIATLTRWVESGAAWPASAGQHAGATAGKVRPFDLAERARHWSCSRSGPRRSPAVRDASWPANDRRPLPPGEARSKAGLAPAGDADRATLIRRATFDLIGLPPRPAEVAAFEADPDSNAEAFGRVVDRSSPRPTTASAGRGTGWTSSASPRRRATSSTTTSPFAYRYRDYLIRAFNADLPYDRFVVEQVAGDLLPEPRRDPSHRHRRVGPWGPASSASTRGSHSPVDLREDRATRVDNQVDVLGKAFLGLTIACARCHDHKFDAITTKDYYALAGFLNSSRHALAFLDPPAKDAAPLAELADLRRRIASALPPAEATPIARRPARARRSYETFDGPDYRPLDSVGRRLRHRADDRRVRPGRGATASPRCPRAWPTAGPSPTGSAGRSGRRPSPSPAPRRSSCSRRGPRRAGQRRGRGFEKIRSPIYGGLVVDVNHGAALRWIAVDVAQWAGLPAYLEIDDGATVDFTGNNGVDSATAGAGSPSTRSASATGPPRPTPPPLHRPKPPAAVAPAGRAVSRGRGRDPRRRDARASALVDGTGVDTRVHVRGSVKNLGEPVPRRFLEVLGGTNPGSPGEAAGSGRLDLARRIADPANPLTARVLVNRLWHHHFGRGIVASVDDFGAMGREAPTHPELLDHLADRFVASGWSIKAMHRLILNSRAYRMASTPTPEADRHRPGQRPLAPPRPAPARRRVDPRRDPRRLGPARPDRGRPRRPAPPDPLHGRSGPARPLRAARRQRPPVDLPQRPPELRQRRCSSPSTSRPPPPRWAAGTRLERPRAGAHAPERPVPPRPGQILGVARSPAGPPRSRPRRPGSPPCTAKRSAAPPSPDEAAAAIAFLIEGRASGDDRLGLGRPGARPVQRQGVRRDPLIVPALRSPPCIADASNRPRSTAGRCWPGAPTGSGRWRSPPCWATGPTAGRGTRGRIRPDGTPAGALPGEGEERHLPVHGRRAVAGRHVRPQAPARPRARPADQDEGRADPVQQRRQGPPEPLEVPEPGGEPASRSRTSSRTSAGASTTWRWSGRWSRTSPSTPPPTTSCTPAPASRGGRARGPG